MGESTGHLRVKHEREWAQLHVISSELLYKWQAIYIYIRGMFEMNCLFLSGDFKFQVSPKVLISCPRSTPRG